VWSGRASKPIGRRRFTNKVSKVVAGRRWDIV
jgi:hypothetical protein